MSKITWELSPESVTAILATNKKTFSYIKAKLSRFYLGVNDEGLDLYFKDNAGIMKYHLDVTFIDKPSGSKIFAVDFQKFINALLRFQVEGALFKLSDSLISIVDINNKSTVVKLSASLTTDDLDIILQEKEDNKDKMVIYKHNEVLDQIFSLSSKLMNNGQANNCLAIIDGKTAMYADRSLIYKESCKTEFKDATVPIHSFLLGFILNTFDNAETTYYMDFRKHALYFNEGDIQAYLLSEKPDVSTPTDAELKKIRPSEKDNNSNIYKLSGIELATGLDFFDGFFEKDVWKPITFEFEKEVKDYARLSYTSPVSEVGRSIDGNFTVRNDSTFTLMSTPILTILNNILKDGEPGEITIVENPEWPGVSITSTGSEMELVLAKLNFNS